MHVVACLHTDASNVAVFEAVCPPGLQLHHAVRADLLAEAERLGGLTEELAGWTRAALLTLARQARVVPLTCSSLGAAVDGALPTATPVLRVDAVLAEMVARRPGRIVVLCVAPPALAPARAMFGHGGRVEVRLVPGAWALFRNRDLAAYHQAVADAADAACMAGADTVALAQASMTPAAELCRTAAPLTSPGVALQAALQLCG